MNVKIEVPLVLRRFTNNTSDIFVDAGTVGEALCQLLGQYPALRASLYTVDGQRRSYIGVFLNSSDIRYLGGEATKIVPGDCLLLLASISGG